MINWNEIGVSIDNQALYQINQYFKDLEGVLEKQQLVYKKEEIFDELENHIIDYIKNQDIKHVDYSSSKQLLSELGSPDEYGDFSTIPGLIEEVNPKKFRNTTIPYQYNKINYVRLCKNCNEKNDILSNYCINCGQELIFKKKIDFDSYISTIDYVFNKKRFFFFNMATIYLIAFSLLYYIFPTQFVFSVSVFAIFVNDLIIIPLSYVYSEMVENVNQKPGYLFITYLIKGSVITVPLFIIFPLLGLASQLIVSQLFVLLYSLWLILIPILLMKKIFFNKNSKYAYQEGKISQKSNIRNLNLAIEISLLLLGFFIFSKLFMASIGPLELVFIESVYNILPLCLFGLEALIFSSKYGKRRYQHL